MNCEKCKFYDNGYCEKHEKRVGWFDACEDFGDKYLWVLDALIVALIFTIIIAWWTMV